MRYLGMHHQSHQYWLDIMHQSKYKGLTNDRYNEGPLIDELETRIAALLGKPDALFFNKGTTCQMAALKVHCEQKNNNKVILHPQSHIALDEQDAYQSLMGLEGVLLGKDNKPFTAKDLTTIKDEVAVLTVELPLRRAGFKLTPWEDLLKMRQWCKDNHVMFHLDGARLWESAVYYGYSWPAISNLFDSIYVSLYKGIGAISGAVLAGDGDFLDKCQVWRNRLGSNMWTAFPTLITALEGIDKNLNQMAGWVHRASDIATALNKVDGLHVEPPHTNGFQLKINADPFKLNSQFKKTCRDMQITPCKPFTAVKGSKQMFTEIQVGAD
ncbi:MAG: threonine aldolase family protein, partial [Marinicella sp.]